MMAPLQRPIPHSSASAWEKYKNTKAPKNPALIFERFVPLSAEKAESRKMALAEVLEAAGQLDMDLLEAYYRRWLAAACAAQAEQPFSLETDWRLVVGLGQKGPLEIGFTFHRYGFPFLPGSSLKGLARLTGLLALAERLNTHELNELARLMEIPDEAESRAAVRQRYTQVEDAVWQTAFVFRTIFGTQAAAGHAIFFDAIPDATRIPRLELDVMTPHYSSYYREQLAADPRCPPADNDEPVPVLFLTVAHQVSFWFAVGWRGLSDDNETLRRLAKVWYPDAPEEWLNKLTGSNLRLLAQRWLKKGLNGFGIGGKTSSGYGFFKPRRKPEYKPVAGYWEKSSRSS